MNIDFDVIRPTSSDWFSPNVEYEGQGRAEFSDPHLTLEGYVKIKFDQFGNQSVVMDVEDVKSESLGDVPPEISIPSVMALLTCMNVEKELVKGSSKVVKQKWVASRRKNRCTKLIVSTSDGVFSALENVYYSNISINIGTLGPNLTIKFHLSKSQFDLEKTGSTKYWVLPLSNFISQFMQMIPELRDHPLRINPDGKLIVFEFNDGNGFIEPLKDYGDCEKRLLAGTERNITTAVMIGEVGTKLTHQFSDLSEWFPFDFLSLLGLATGSEVGAPWIEFRDGRGRLVRRIHVRLGRPSFSKGHRNIDEVIHRGTGTLLTKYQLSEHSGNSYLMPTLKHIIRGGLSSLNIEDNMSHIFRAFEGLCEHYGLNTQDLTQNLDHSQRIFVKETLKKATIEIREKAKSSCKSDQRDALTRIASRTENACNTDQYFGLKAIGLIDQFDLLDAKIIDAHYQTNPRLDKRMWHQVLSHYRGVVFHQGFFDFNTGEYDFYDLLRIKYHLHDILIRIVLKMLCYDGTYQRAVPISGDWEAPWPVDWVKPDTPASELGYE